MNIRILVLLIFSQCLMACQQEQEKSAQASSPPSLAAASMAFISGDRSQDSEKAKAPAANVILRSEDGGKSWQDLSTGLPGGFQPQGVYVSDDEVFLSSGEGLYRSGQSGAPAWEHSMFLQGRVSHVFAGPTALYACSYGLGVFRSLYGGDFWQEISATLKDKMVRTVLETKAGPLFIGSENGIYKSADGGQSWKRVHKGSMVLNLAESGGVLIGGGLEGVLRSTDGGEHWENVLDLNILAKNTGIIGDRLFSILGTRNVSKLSPEGITGRLRTSADGGQTWQRIDQAAPSGMDQDLSQTRDIYDIVQSGKYLFCSFDTGIYRSADQGKSWELVLPVKGDATFNQLVVSGNTIYAVQGIKC